MKHRSYLLSVLVVGLLAPVAHGEPVAGAAAPESEIRVAGKAIATTMPGGGLATPTTTLFPLLFERSWTSHGAMGGFDASGGGWVAFFMRTSGAAGAPRIRGRVRFSEDEGAIRAEWRVTPDADADLAELCIGATVPFSEYGGGAAILDGAPLEIPAMTAPKPHLFRGAVTQLALRDLAGAERLSIAFDEPTRILLQDGRHWNGNSLTLRFFFAEGPVEGGREYALRARVSTPAAGRLALRKGRPVRIEADASWIPLANEPLVEPGSALDFSAVVPHHAPAGKFGRVIAVGGHFEFERLPGVPQRFYGVNICGNATTPASRELADRFAANLARMGYNSLRIHHHERALLGGTYREGMDDTTPDPEAMDRFDALVAACIDHGIYLTTDLFVSRSWFTTWRSLGIDQDGTLPDTQTFKILCAFWEPAYTNLCAWTRNFLGHVNPHTGRRLADEPALCTLALVNEGNLGNWGGRKLEQLPCVQQAWAEWLARKQAGGDPAWKGIPATIPQELYADDGATPERRHAAAFVLFLSDAETRLADRLRAFLRDELRCQTPLSSLSSWYNPVQYQMTRMHFDYVDDHFYVDHPSFLDVPWKLPSRSPNVNPMTGSAAGARSVAFRRLMDKPFCLTEFNYSAPGRFRGVGGIATGALGALQDWSGIWRFAWTHGSAGIEKPETKAIGYFDLSGDPLSLAAERAALCLFLRGDLPALSAAYPVELSESALRDPRNGARKCEAVSWLWAGWHARLGTTVSPGKGSAPQGQADAPAAPGSGVPAAPRASFASSPEQVRADLEALGAEKPGKGAVSLDRATGTFLLDTPRTAGGFAESGTHDAGPLHFTLLPLQGGEEAEAANIVPATVWASSLDGAPLASSSHILVTHLTDVQNSGIKYADAALTTLLAWGGLPHLMRCGAADLSLAVGDGEWIVYRLSPSGRRLGEVPAVRDAESGRLSFTARTDQDPAAATFLYELEKRP